MREIFLRQKLENSAPRCAPAYKQTVKNLLKRLTASKSWMI